MTSTQPTSVRKRAILAASAAQRRGYEIQSERRIPNERVTRNPTANWLPGGTYKGMLQGAAEIDGA